MSVSQTLTEEFLGDGLAKAAELYEIVDEMLQVDKRFVGMSKYVANVKMFWTYAVPTAAAATGHLFFNPKFWDSLPTETRKTVVAHEIWHLLLRHSDRGEGMDRETYNIAADHVINLGLEEEGFTFDGTTPCKDAKYKGKSTEEIYSIIYAKKKKNPDNPETKGQPHPSPDELEDLVKQAIEGSGKDIQQVADQDAKEADDAVGKGIGTCAGGENLILVADSQKVFIKEATYHEIFEDYLIDPLSGGKRTFLRPSRRQQPGGMRLPGRFKKRGKHNRLTHLVYALDVSGSISKAQAQQFQRSAKTLKETLNPERMTVILWDTRIVFEKTFTDTEPYTDIRVRAGGGTNLKPVFERVAQINPEALVIFTDLCVNMPPKPAWDIIWLVTDNTHNASNVTYGDVYRVPKEENP